MVPKQWQLIVENISRATSYQKVKMGDVLLVSTNKKYQICIRKSPQNNSASFFL